MKFKALALSLVMVALATTAPLFVQPAQAQTVVSTTTLTADLADINLSPNANVVTVSSTTGMTAGGPTTSTAITTSGGATFLYVDLEQMRVIEVISSTQVRVQRAVAGFSSRHANTTTVQFGPATAFKAVDPPIGYCTPSTFIYQPWINVANGNQSVCQRRGSDTTFKIYTTNSRKITYDSTAQTCTVGSPACSG